MRGCLWVFGFVALVIAATTWLGAYGPDASRPNAGKPDASSAASRDSNRAELAPDADASTYFIDAKVRLAHPFYACASQDDLDKIKAMQRAHDLEAMIAAARNADCLELETGDRGTVADHSVWHASTCLRRAGEPDCRWLPDAVLEKDTRQSAPASAAAAMPAAARDVDAPRCKGAIADLIVATGARVTGVSPMGENVFLAHPAAHEMSLSCARFMRLSVFASTETGQPKAAYYALVAAAGAAITREPLKSLAPLIRRCQAKAHRDKDEMAEDNLAHVEVDCQSFDRDGGGTAITVAQGKDAPIPSDPPR